MAPERKVVDILETEQDQSGYVTLHGDAPFTGLIVEVSVGKEVVGVAELIDGRRHGYSVDYLNGHPTAVDEYDLGTPHGLRATWIDARLTDAARFQYGIEDQQIRRDGTIENLPEAAAKIARIHARRRKHTLLTASVHELLARFNQICNPLLAEARRGLGLV